MYAKVMVDVAHSNVDRLFTYEVPNDLAVTAGQRVLIPFGGNNRSIEGFVLELSENAPEKCLKCESPAELFKAQKDGIARMRCSICGFEIEGDTAPDRCENCGVDGDMFEPVKN